MKVSNIEQMKQDMLDGVTDFTIDNKCSNCGNCCSNLLPLTEREIRRIKVYIKKHNIKAFRMNIFDNSVIQWTCPFRNEDKKICNIYNIRPQICKSFRCDKPHKQGFGDAELLKAYHDEKPIITNMRDTFFGKDK